MRSLNSDLSVYEGIDLVSNKLIVWLFETLESVGHEVLARPGTELLGGIPWLPSLSRVPE